MWYVNQPSPWWHRGPNKKSFLDISQVYGRQVVKVIYGTKTSVLINRPAYLLASKKHCNCWFWNLFPVLFLIQQLFQLLFWASADSTMLLSLSTYSCRQLWLVISFEWAMSFRLCWLGMLIGFRCLWAHRLLHPLLLSCLFCCNISKQNSIEILSVLTTASALCFFLVWVQWISLPSPQSLPPVKVFSRVTTVTWCWYWCFTLQANYSSDTFVLDESFRDVYCKFLLGRCHSVGSF